MEAPRVKKGPEVFNASSSKEPSKNVNVGLMSTDAGQSNRLVHNSKSIERNDQNDE